MPKESTLQETKNFQKVIFQLEQLCELKQHIMYTLDKV